MRAVSGQIDENVPGFLRWQMTPAGNIAVLSSELRFVDRLGAWKVRWCINRMRYTVPPGLYAIGNPDNDSPVICTANYKMSWDSVRAALDGRNAWLLVLETYGVNVWCAAGKGTFGTGELVKRIERVNLTKVVSHRTIILPLLGAPGVKVHEVVARSGFRPVFSVFKASSLPVYLDQGMNVAPEMRELSFPLWDRLALTPVELILGVAKGWPVLLLLFLAGLLEGGSSPWGNGVVIASEYLVALLAGSLFVPALLPWLPFRSFAANGALVGLVTAFCWQKAVGGVGNIWQTIAAYCFIVATSAFFALTFTGSTPYTSRSGVKKEMRLSMPAMALTMAAGLVSWVIGTFF